MANTVDIQRVFSGSVSEVTLDSLSKRGFKQVKVLNQANVMRLIAEAVDRVLSERSEEISSAEREKVIAESRVQFQQLAKQKLEQERTKLEDLELINRTLKEQLETAKNRDALSMEIQAERDQAVARIQSLESEVATLQKQLDDLRQHAQEKAQGVGSLRKKIEDQAAELDAETRKAKRAAELQTLVDKHSSEAAGLRQELASLKRDSGEKTRLESELTELRSRLESKAAVESELTELRSQLESKAAVEGELAELRSQLESKGAVEGELAELRSQLESKGVVEGELTELRSQLESKAAVEGEVVALRAKLEASETAASEVATLRSQLESKAEVESEAAGLRGQLAEKGRLQSEIATLRDQLAQKRELEDELVQLRSEVDAKARTAATERAEIENHLGAEQRRVVELEELVDAKSREIEEIRKNSDTESTLERFMATFADRMGGSQKSGEEVSELKNALHGLTEKLAKVSFGGVASGEDAPPPDEVSLEAFFSKADKEDVESNVKNVKVRQSKAGGVTGALAKLKKMQQGGDTDE